MIPTTPISTVLADLQKLKMQTPGERYQELEFRKEKKKEEQQVLASGFTSTFWGLIEADITKRLDQLRGFCCTTIPTDANKEDFIFAQAYIVLASTLLGMKAEAIKAVQNK